MINYLENSNIKIAVKSKGAELCSLACKESNKEYVWQADPKYWGKHSPILFPIVGTLKDGVFVYNDKVYELSRHGFARDNEFKLTREESNKLVYSFSYSEDTLEKYPFKFQLNISYIIDGKTLRVQYDVENLDDKEIYFSIGGHPALNCNLECDKSYIEFEKEESLSSRVVNKTTGLIEKNKKSILKEEKNLKLNNELFIDDALVFEGIKSKYLILNDKESGNVIKFTIDEFHYLGIWSSMAPFVCIEPWCGIADFEESDKILENKVGIEKLGVGENFSRGFNIELIK